MEPKEDKIGYYYTKSDISLMKIRVTVDEFSSTQLLKKSFASFIQRADEGESGIGMCGLSENQTNGGQTYDESVNIRWQQKILSPYERRNAETINVNDAPDTLNQSRRRHKNKGVKRIFTYVDTDHYKQEDFPPTLSWKDGSATQLRNRFKPLYHQKNLEEEKKYLLFYIMADLTSEESIGETMDNEVVLCKLKYNSRGELLADPDFSRKDKKPYRIVGIGKGNAIYEYTVSVVPENIEEEKEADTIITVKTKHLGEFDKICDSSIRMVFVGELVRASHFIESSSPLYIQYQLYLPPGWTSEDDFPLHGISEACVPTYDSNQTPLCNFSFPLQFYLRRSTQAKGWPCLIFTAFFKEWLTHDKDAGVGFLQLPYPGHNVSSEMEIKTWRPSFSTHLERLRRFFLGGVHLITDPSFFIPSLEEVSLISRFGLRTESSGSIWLHLHSALQINTESIDRHLFEENTELTKSWYHPATLAVISAFHKSCARFQAAKANLTSASSVKSYNNDNHH